LFRAIVVRLKVDIHVLLLTLHHIIADGWSLGVFGRELGAIYEALRAGTEPRLPELELQYRDYAAWQREWLQGEMLERQLGYWRAQLAGAPLLELPTDRPRPPIAGHRGASFGLEIDERLTSHVKELAREAKATVFMAVQASFQLLLARYSGQDDIVIGTDIANRNLAETEGLIGFFVNQLALRTRVKREETFGELLGRVREASLEAYDHQDVPFERLVEE